MVLAPAPSVILLVLAAIGVIAGFVVLSLTAERIAPPRPRPAEQPAALRSEPPAVVNMLSNDATLTTDCLCSRFGADGMEMRLNGRWVDRPAWW